MSIILLAFIGGLLKALSSPLRKKKGRRKDREPN